MAEAKRKLLIVEDDQGLQRQLVWTFDEYEVFSAGDRNVALEKVRSEAPPVVMLDLGLPPDPDGASEGLAILQHIRELNPQCKVIVVTGNTDREHALKAIDLGAYDFYQKPINADTIRLLVARAFNLYALESENRRLHRFEQRTPLPGMVTAYPPLLSICALVEKLAGAGVTVLILGESGTGKEVIARAIHDLGPRADKRFVAINCAAIPETLLESELFGHEKGSFTGAHKQVLGKIELAHQGTLFLDEIGDMPLPLQVKILRFLEERTIERIGGRVEIPVDTRVICATHRVPEELIKAEQFREDLYYRVSEIVIKLPPLRERGGDALLLAKHFLHQADSGGVRSMQFTPDAIVAIERYGWPGNVRELTNRVKRGIIMAGGRNISAEDLDLPVKDLGPSPNAPLATLSLREARDRAERDAIHIALNEASGNVTQAARLLDISRPTLYELMRYHKIRTDEIRADARGVSAPS